jgi:hypothetical protein
MDVIATRLRATGQTVLASSNIVALTRALPADADQGTLERTLGARQVVHATATLGAEGWTVYLVLDEPGVQRHFAEARGADIIGTARVATDRLAVAVGRSPPAEQPDRAMDVNEILERAKLAVLTDDKRSAWPLR